MTEQLHFLTHKKTKQNLKLPGTSESKLRILVITRFTLASMMWNTLTCDYGVAQSRTRLQWLSSKWLYWSEVKWNEVAQSCPTLCNPMDSSLPGSSIPGILQAGILDWVAISFSRRSSQPRDRTWVSRIAGRRFTIWATREVFISLVQK